MVGATFIVYVCLMMLIGYLAYRRTKNLSDYILGGRRLGSCKIKGSDPMKLTLIASHLYVYILPFAFS